MYQKEDAVVEALDTRGQHEELFAFAAESIIAADPLCQKGDAVVGALDTPGQHEELFVFADDRTLGAAAPDESPLILKLQLMT